MVKPEWGTRYTCAKCGTKFYDLNKPEPICPSCEFNQKKRLPKASAQPKTPARSKSAYVEKSDDDEDTDPEEDETEGPELDLAEKKKKK